MLRVGRRWEMGQEGRTGQELMLFMIVSFSLRRCVYVAAVGAACVSDLAGRIGNNNAYFETVLSI
jgi:hypothetical protein